MAFFLAPRFAPAYAPQCSPLSCTPSRPSHPRQSRAARSSVPSFAPFLSQLDDLFSALDRQARQQTEQKQRQRKRIIRAHFNVHDNNDRGYQIDGEIPGFEQDQLDIEVVDEHTLRIAGNTEKTAAQARPTQAEAAGPEAHDEAMGAVTVDESDVAPTIAAAESEHSDTESHKSHHAFVEDDFEDLGAEVEAASTPPASSKGKDKATDESPSDAVAVQTRSASVADPETRVAQETEDRFYGAFDRTFRFPDRIDASSVRASLRNGLLSVVVPRAKAPEVKRISIQ